MCLCCYNNCLYAVQTLCLTWVCWSTCRGFFFWCAYVPLCQTISHIILLSSSSLSQKLPRMCALWLMPDWGPVARHYRAWLTRRVLQRTEYDTQLLVQALVISCHDCCNGPLAALITCSTEREVSWCQTAQYQFGGMSDDLGLEIEKRLCKQRHVRAWGTYF